MSDKVARAQTTIVNFLIIGLLIGLGLLICFVAFIMSNYPNLPSRLTNSLNEHVKNQGIFTPEKLIESKEDSAPNGDTGLTGTYKLKKVDIEKLWNIDQLLVCPQDKSCKIDPIVIDGDRKCQNAKQDADIYMNLCLDKASYQVYWSYSIT